MLAIETYYIGPTNYRGSRVVARVMENAPTRKLTLDWDDALGIEENHRTAATALIQKLGWTDTKGYGQWIVGASDRGYVFVCQTRHGGDVLTVHAALEKETVAK